jgi:integrase
MLSSPAAIAHAPKRRPLASAASRAWNAQQLRAFFDLTEGHRFQVVLWVAANTGMRRGELLGLRCGNPELDAARLSVNRSLVSVGYALHESRGKTRTARRCIDLDGRTVDMLRPCASRDDDAYLSARDDGAPYHPQLLSDASRSSCIAPGCLASVCTTSDTLTRRCC